MLERSVLDSDVKTDPTPLAVMAAPAAEASRPAFVAGSVVFPISVTREDTRAEASFVSLLALAWAARLEASEVERLDGIVMEFRARPDARDVVKSCWQLDKHAMIKAVTAMAEARVTADLRIDGLQQRAPPRENTRGNAIIIGGLGLLR
jgi:hypothetical protein